MTTKSFEDLWNVEQYWLKGVRYFKLMESTAEDDSPAFWACLSVEFFTRAALCRIHPVLNADPQQHEHLLFAFGGTSPKHPKTIPMHSVFPRLHALRPAQFTSDHVIHAEYMIKLRNEHLHTSKMPFENLRESDWLAGYYDVVFATAKIAMRKPLELFQSAKAMSKARALVKSRQDKRRSAVMREISKHRAEFDKLSVEERERRQTDAANAAKRVWSSSKTTSCPACKCDVVLTGGRTAIAEPIFTDGQLVAEATHATEAINCVACGLRLRSASEIAVAKLPPKFREYEYYDLHESRDEEDEREYDNM